MKTVRLISWNLENLFHPLTGGPRNDFTPHEGWTLEKYEAKLTRLASVFSQMINNYTQKHDTGVIFGLTEVENPSVAEELFKKVGESRFKVALDNDFKASYHDSVVVYDERFFHLLSCRYHKTFARYDKGDMCVCEFEIKKTSEKVTLFSLHLKARPSNRYYTQMYREAVCDNIQNLIWRLHGGHIVEREIALIKDEMMPLPTQLKSYPHVVIMGDFNDEPFSSSMMEYLGATYDIHFVRAKKSLLRVPLYNASFEKLFCERPGTNYYEGSMSSSWSMLDQMIFSPSLVDIENKEGLRYKKGSFEVIQNLTSDSNGIPLRTNSWDENDNIIWLEGFSDHFPITAELELRLM